MSGQFTLVSYDMPSNAPAAAAVRGQNNRVDLHQELPSKFASSLTRFLSGGEEPLATLFVTLEEALETRTPNRALVLTEDGVLFMEEGEVTLNDTHWGVKSLFYPYSQITAVGMGAALLIGRFTLHGAGSAPPCEIPLHSEDVPRFEAVSRLIGEKIASEGKCSN